MKTMRCFCDQGHRIALCVVLALFCGAIAWSFHLTSFLHPKMLVFALATVGLAALSRWRESPGWGVFVPLWLGLVFWGISGLWVAHVPAFHIEGIIHFGVLLSFSTLACGAFTCHNGRLWIIHGFVVSGVVVALLALMQYAGWLDRLFPMFPAYDQRAYSVFGNQNLLGGYVAVALTLSCVLLFRLRAKGWLLPWLYMGAYMLLLGALIVSATRSAWLAAFVGSAWVALPTLYRRFRRGRLQYPRVFSFVFVLATCVLLFLGGPLLMARLTNTFSEMDVGGPARLWFWAGALRMCSAAPWLGVGLGNFNYWSPLFQGQVLWDEGGERYFQNELHTVHAHCEPLEWLAETGIVGCLFWGWFLIRCYRKRNPALPALVALALFSCFNTISHSAPHMVMGLLLAAAGDRRTYSFPAVPRGAYLVVATVLLVSFVAMVFLPSLMLCHAEQLHIRGGEPDALYQRAIVWPWPAYRAHESYAVALMDNGNYLEARRHLQLAAAGIDTGRIHLLLTMCAVALEEPAQASKHARDCLYRWPRNGYAWSVVLSDVKEEEMVFWERSSQRFHR